MTPKQYTELYFLDEATALATGHRPCAECRREEFKKFCSAWCAGRRPGSGNTSTSATAIDYQIHLDRNCADGAQLRTESELMDLPTGTMVELPSVGYCLWWRQKLFLWTTVGYELVAQPRHFWFCQTLDACVHRGSIEARLCPYRSLKCRSIDWAESLTP